jgi:hypothetical protein
MGTNINSALVGQKVTHRGFYPRRDRLYVGTAFQCRFSFRQKIPVTKMGIFVFQANRGASLLLLKTGASQPR